MKATWYDEDIDSNLEQFYFANPDIVAPLGRDICNKLFNRVPEPRLGANGATEVKAHPFFEDLDWQKVLHREYKPVFTPNDARFCLVDINSCEFPATLMTEEDKQKLAESFDRIIEDLRTSGAFRFRDQPKELASPRSDEPPA